MTLELRRGGNFSWKDWAEHLSAEIAAGRERGNPDCGDTYYYHWLAAVEKLVAKKGLASANELGRHKRQWDVAARNTSRGQFIELEES